MTLREIFKVYNIGRGKLLKMDCEGAEYEILQASEDLLDKVDNISMEVHMNKALKELGYSEQALMEMIYKHVPKDNVKCNSAEINDDKEILPDFGRQARQEQKETPA